MDKKPTGLKEASSTLYHAFQFIAMAARFFIANKEDDSHTNADWNSEKNWLIGNAINSPYGAIHIALDYPLLVLIITDHKFIPIAEIELNGKNRLEIFNWLNNQLWKLGLEVDEFEPELHYELIDHPVLHGEKFEMKRPKDFLELANYRSNGHAILNKVSAAFEDKSDVRIWPHHFDDGVIVNIKRDHDSVVSLLSMGLAMPDKHYDQPYFYVNAWHKSGVDYSTLPSLKSKGHWHVKEWHGQVLLAESIAGENDHLVQLKICTDFFEEAMANALAILK
jgi:hypothetical protein